MFHRILQILFWAGVSGTFVSGVVFRNGVSTLVWLGYLAMVIMVIAGVKFNENSSKQEVVHSASQRE